MMTSRTRLAKELKEISKDKDPTIRLAPDGENLLRWTAQLQGPSETPFETGTFTVSFVVPESYPLAPPKASFVTKIFHPNVHFKTGEICLDILKTAWSPAWTLHSVCRAILALMCNPEPDSPLNCDAGNMLRAGDDIAYWSMARMYTVDAAGGTCPADPYFPPVTENAETDRWWWEKTSSSLLSEGGSDQKDDAGGGGGAEAAGAGTTPTGPDERGAGVGGAVGAGVGPTAGASGSGSGSGSGGRGGNFAAADTAAGRAAAAAQVDARAAAAAAAAARFHASAAASRAALKAADEAGGKAGQ